MPLISLIIAILLSGCRSAPEPPDNQPRAEDGAPTREAPSLKIPEGIDLGITPPVQWRFADRLPPEREAAFTDSIRNAGGRFGAESVTSDTAQFIAERAQAWWIVWLSFHALRPARYEHNRRYSDPSLPPLDYVRAFLVSPDFVAWANELGMHLFLPLDRPEDELFENVRVYRANASGPLVLHSSIRSLIVKLPDLDQVDADGLIEQLPTLTKLERVKVLARDVERARRFFEALPKGNIRTINFTGDPRPVASMIGSFPRLERLSIRFQPTEEVLIATRESRIPTPLKGLSASESLEKLKISGTPARDTFLYGEGAIDEIAGIATLRVLELPDAGLTDEHVQKIATLPDLEALDVSYDHGVTASTLFGTSYNPIPGRLTDEAAVTLARSKSLRRLDIHGYRLTARAHKALAGKENLEELTIAPPVESSPE